MPRLIDVHISPTGETTIETRGFTGPACQQATQPLEVALGLKQSETLTAEYHQTHIPEAGLTIQPNS